MLFLIEYFYFNKIYRFRICRQLVKYRDACRIISVVFVLYIITVYLRAIYLFFACVLLAFCKEKLVKIENIVSYQLRLSRFLKNTIFFSFRSRGLLYIIFFLPSYFLVAGVNARRVNIRIRSSKAPPNTRKQPVKIILKIRPICA